MIKCVSNLTSQQNGSATQVWLQSIKVINYMITVVLQRTNSIIVSTWQAKMGSGNHTSSHIKGKNAIDIAASLVAAKQTLLQYSANSPLSREHCFKQLWHWNYKGKIPICCNNFKLPISTAYFHFTKNCQPKCCWLVIFVMPLPIKKKADSKLV